MSCAAAMAIFASLVVVAQAPPQPPVFRGGASLVRVDVTVTDRHGEPVTSLTPDDFELREDGAPQTVETFKLVSADGRPAEGDDTSLEIRSPEHAAAEAARDDVRVFLIFWDEYHIDRFASAIAARKALAEFVTTALAPTDLVAMMDPLLPTDVIRWTRNRAELAQGIQKLEGRWRVYLPPRSVLEEAQLGRRDVERLRSEVTVSALKSVASYLGGLREGRKAIIFVSEGIPALDRSDQPSLLQDLVRTANASNTAIYTIDPRGLSSNMADVLWMLAENTGAEAFNTNAPVRALQKVVKQASAFYLLGYASTKNPLDGKFHQIKVRVKRSGLEVRARRGYWAPSVSDMDRAAREAAAEAPSTITTALGALTAVRPDRAVDLWVGVNRGPEGEAEVTVAWTPRTAGATASNASISVVGQTDGGDKRIAEAPMRARRLSFVAPAGVLQLRTTIHDAQGETIGEDTRTISVPELMHVRLALGSPAVFVARNALDLKHIAADTAPFAGREFTRTDRLFVRFTAYGDGAPRADVSARLLSRAGSELVKLAVTSSGGNSYEIDIPLSSIARGDSLVSIEAVAGDDRAEAPVPLRIVS